MKMRIMKKKWLAAGLGTIFGMMAMAQQKFPTQLVGQWEGLQKDASSGLEFTSSDSVYLFYNNEKKLATQVQLDASKNPLWFDFAINDGSEQIQIKSLLIVINEDLLKWQVFTQEARPAHFTQSTGETMFLRRKKP